MAECLVLYKNAPIMIERGVFPRDLIQFALSKLDVIRATNWLTAHGATCNASTVYVPLFIFLVIGLVATKEPTS